MRPLRSHHRRRVINASSSKTMNACQGGLCAHFHHSRRQLLTILIPLSVLVALVGYTAYRGGFPIRVQSLPNQITVAQEVKGNTYGVYTYEIVNEFNHDPTAFTQGLVYAGNDTLYESTGMYGSSSVRRVAVKSGEVLQLHQMEEKYFGEGLTLLNHRLFQVAWRVTFGFIYDESLSLLDSFKHPMQDGWGLTTDGKVLYGSDGTSTIYVMQPSTFAEERKFMVKDGEKEITSLNELEYIDGELWANVWMKDCIVRISPKDGQVLGWILLHNLRGNLLAGGNKLNVLNGIAWDQDRNRIYVTGKYWPKLYEIKVQPHSENLEDRKDVWKRCHIY